MDDSDKSFSAFIEACKNTDESKKKDMLNTVDDATTRYKDFPKKTDTTGNTGLQIASFYNNYDIVELLLNRGADINAINNIKETPLFIACKNGYKNIVELLLNRGADTNIKNYHGDTALMVACLHGNEEIVEILLNKGANVLQNNGGYTALIYACWKDYEKIVEILLKYCTVDIVNKKNIKGRDAFMHTKGDNILNQLLDKGCNVKEQDVEGITTLMYVLINIKSEYNKKTIERILNTGASDTINIQSKRFKHTALMISCRRGQKDIVELLLKYGADLSLKDTELRTAFDYAEKFPEIIQLLKNKEDEMRKKIENELIATAEEEERKAIEKEKKPKTKKKEKKLRGDEEEKKRDEEEKKLRGDEEEKKAQQQKENQRIAYEKAEKAKLKIQKRQSDVLEKLHYCGNKDFQKNIIHLSDLQSTIETTKQQLNNIAQTMISTINESIEKKNKIKLKESQQKFNNSIDTLKTSEKEYEKLTNENINKLNDCYKSYFYMKDIKHINQRGTIQIAIDFSKDKDIYDSIKIHGIFPDDKVAINDTPKTVELEELYKELETVDSSPFFDPSKLNQEWYYYFYMKHYINFFTHEKLCLESFNRHFNFTKQDIDIFKYNIIFLSEPIIYKLYDGLYSQLKKIFSSKKSNKQKNDEMNTILYANFSSFDKIAILKEEEETEKNEYNMKIDFKIVFNSEEGIWQFPPPISFEKDGKRSKRLKKSIKIRSKRLKKSIKIRSKRLKKSIKIRSKRLKKSMKIRSKRLKKLMKIRSKRLKSIKRSRKKFFNHKN